MEKRLLAYFSRKIPDARDVAISGFTRLASGASRETYALTLRWSNEVAPHSLDLILRRDPTGSLLQTSREHEFVVLKAAHEAGLKAPKPLYLELDPAVLGRPFFVMQREPGRVSSLTMGAISSDEPEALRRQLRDDCLSELARMQALDYRKCGLDQFGVPASFDSPARDQTREWREIYERDRMGERYPCLEAAFAWLEANPVRTDRITIVHGDWRCGNFLYDERGLISILDWEMCHLGDPMEDLGWFSMQYWGLDGLAGGLFESAELFDRYEGKTGYRPDPKRVFFYQVLGNVKMAVICLTGIRAFVEGQTPDPLMALLKPGLLPLFADLSRQLEIV